MRKQLFFAVIILLSATTAKAAGYQLNLQGLRQLAMGGSGTAVPWDVSTIFYNPGALSRLDGMQASVSGLSIMPSVEYAQLPTGSYTAKSQAQSFYPFNIYIGSPLKKGSPWAVGIGVYTPFGSGLKWDDNWTGRYMVQSITLQSIFVQPTVSYLINDKISVGAGFVYAFGSLDLKQALPLQDQAGSDGEAELKGNANGVGFNLGVHLKATEKLQFGITYRSQVNMKVSSGNATFNVPTSMLSYFPNTTFTSSLPLPQVFSVGAGYKINNKLTVQLDLNYVIWSAYDSLDFNFATHTAQLKDAHLPRLYQNTLAVRLGANYDISNKFSVMAGGAWDPSPVHDGYVSPELPDANRAVFTCGLAYRPVSNICIMAACEFVNSVVRDGAYNFENFNGRYQTTAITPGIGLSYDFKYAKK